MTAMTQPLAPRPDVMDFLATRRSRPAKTLTAPAPDRAALEPILTAALRAPDHGKLEPWRLIVLEGAALDRLAAVTARIGTARGLDPDKLAKAESMFSGAPLVVAVIAAPDPDAKIPVPEQTLSAGAVCLGLVNAAHASGWGANWLSGWMAHDAAWGAEALDLSAPEWVAGLVVIGTETLPPPDRPRPDTAAKVAWVSA